MDDAIEKLTRVVTDLRSENEQLKTMLHDKDLLLEQLRGDINRLIEMVDVHTEAVKRVINTL